MSDTVTTGRVSPTFFGRFLTLRHFLTRRTAIGLVALLMLIGGGTLVALQGLNLGNENPSSAAGPATGEGGMQARLLNVEVTPVTRRPPAELVQTYTGTVQPRRVSVLAAKVGGRLESILVDTGSSVAAGELLAELDQVQVTAQIDAAKAALNAAEARLAELVKGPRSQDIEQASSRVSEIQASLSLREASFERISRLFRSGSVSQQEFDESKFALDGIRAQLQAAKQELDKLLEGSRLEKVAASRATVESLAAQLRVLEADHRERRILAPFNGQIQSRFVDEGTIVAPGQQIVQIVESPPYEIRVGVPASDLACLEDVRLQVHFQGQELDATLSRIAPALNDTTQTQEVFLSLSPESSQAVPLGGAVTVSSRRTRESQGIWVPTSALTQGSRGLWAIYVAVPASSQLGTTDASSTSVETLGEAVVERRQVERILQAGELWSEVQGPISEGELIVASGPHRIAPGQRVKCVQAD